MALNSTSVLGSSGVNTTGSTSKTGSSSSGAGKVESPQEIQDRFMSLLVAQLKNQDPLQPMDNAAVTSQMAQLSTVTGINNLNTSMKNVASSIATGQTASATNLLGRTVMVAGNDLTLSGGQPVKAAIDAQQAADTVSVDVKNSVGQTVRTLDLGAVEAGTHEFSWDGKDDSGNTVADGNYTFDITAKAAGKDAAVNPMDLTTVVGLQNNATSGPQLLTAAGGKVSMSDIKQIF